MKKIFPLVLISIGVAMISVLSQFTIPFGPIPLTLQTLMIGIIGTIYKPSHAFVTVCLYLLLGFLGFPVFAGGAGGASHFLGPTAGFLLFFPFRAWITSPLFFKKVEQGNTVKQKRMKTSSVSF